MTFGSTPLPVTATTRNDIAFLVANPYRPLFATVTGGRYIQAIIVLQEFDDFAAAHPLSFTTLLKLSLLDVIGGINVLSYICSLCVLCSTMYVCKVKTTLWCRFVSTLLFGGFNLMVWIFNLMIWIFNLMVWMFNLMVWIWVLLMLAPFHQHVQHFSAPQNFEACFNGCRFMPILEAIFQHKFCSTKARKNGVVVGLPKGLLVHVPMGPLGSVMTTLERMIEFLEGPTYEVLHD